MVVKLQTQDPDTEQAAITSAAHHPSSSLLGRVLVIAAVALIAFGGWHLAKNSFTPTKKKLLTHAVSRQDLKVSVIEQGTLESSNNTEVTCRVRGFNTVTKVIPGGTVVEPGDELVLLDTKVVEEAYSLTKTNTHIATATLERTRADVAKAKIAIDAYLEGRYRNQKTGLENQIKIANRNLQTAETLYENSKQLFEDGHVTALEVESNEFNVTQAKLELKVQETQLSVLNEFTKEMELETLNGNLTASQSKLQADEAGLEMEKARRQRAKEDVENCVITAERGGLVIYPSSAAWKDTPDIAQGATVRKDQVLLLMPDLTQMQIKVGIHESVIDRVQKGLEARVTLPDKTLNATVSSVATVTRPAGWWTGNVVKYDTIIELPSAEGLKPGMSAEVEVIIAVHEDVLAIPVSCVVETDKGDFCWVQTLDGPKRRSIQLGDTNDVFIMVKGGVKEGDEVVLNPLAFVEEAKKDAASTLQDSDTAKVTPPVTTEPNTEVTDGE